MFNESARVRALTLVGERYLQMSLGKVVPDRVPVAAPKNEQQLPKVDPPNLQAWLCNHMGAVISPLIPEDQDMLPALPTPELLKEPEELRNQYPELAERAWKARGPGPIGSQLVVGSGPPTSYLLPATAVQDSGAPRLGARAEQATGAQSSGAPPLDAGAAEQAAVSPPPGGDE